ncbi:MAG: FAD-binding oxidoreductase, partial [Actinobacteria bacterium]|nr:FAD-binding oxidoreductase [Actinomycetota bacterium]
MPTDLDLISYWVRTAPTPGYAPLEDDLSVDVAVIGGGIVGITTAYLLKREGLRVAVLERREVSRGVTGYTTAKITSSHSLIYKTLLKKFGEEGARTYGRANEAGIEKIASLVDEVAIDCDFERADNYIYTEDPRYADDVRDEVDAARSIGLPAELTTETELPFPVQGAVRFTNQAQFHPRKYLLGLAAAIEGDGSRVFENTTVTGVDEGDPCTVRTERATVTATDVVVATHMPIL